MKHLFFIAFLVMMAFMHAQTTDPVTTMFSNDKIVKLQINDVTINGPGGNDTTNFIVNIHKTGNDTYTYTILKVQKLMLAYKENLICNKPIAFSVNEGKATLNYDFKQLHNSIRKSLVEQYGSDTASFGENWYMLCHPKIYLDFYFNKYIDIVADYLDNKQRNSNTVTLLPGMTDSVPANVNKTITANQEMLDITTLTTLDSVKVRKHMFEKEVERSGPQIKEYMKEKDMIFIPTQITLKAKAKKHSATNVFIVNEIVYEHRQNYTMGTGKDMINTVKMKRE